MIGIINHNSTGVDPVKTKHKEFSKLFERSNNYFIQF